MEDAERDDVKMLRTRHERLAVRGGYMVSWVAKGATAERREDDVAHAGGDQGLELRRAATHRLCMAVPVAHEWSAGRWSATERRAQRF